MGEPARNRGGAPILIKRCVVGRQVRRRDGVLPVHQLSPPSASASLSYTGQRSIPHCVVGGIEPIEVPQRPLRAGAGPKPKLLDQVRDAIRTRHYSYRTEEAYVGWIRRFIVFHHKRHPVAMGPAEITQFLTALAVDRQVSASTQNQALAAVLFLYQQVLGCDPGWLDGIVRAKRAERLPVVLSRREVQVLLEALDGVSWLMAMLLYGAGLRLIECLRLRVKDIEFSRNEIVVREGKGSKDRMTMLPGAVKGPAGTPPAGA